MGVPTAFTFRETFLPTFWLTETGCLVITGAEALTVTDTADEVTASTPLVTTARYHLVGQWARSPATLRVVEVALGMLVKLTWSSDDCHCTVGVGLPVAFTASLVVAPHAIVPPVGCFVIAGRVPPTTLGPSSSSIPNPHEYWSEREYETPATRPGRTTEVAGPEAMAATVGFPGEDAVTVTEPGTTVGLCHATVGLDEPGDTVTDPSVTSLVVGLRRTPPSVAEMQADALTQATAFTGVARSTGDPQVAVEESNIPWTKVDPDAPLQDVEVARAGEMQEIPVIKDAERPGRAVDFQLAELEGLADHVTDPSVALAAAQRPDAAQETSLNAGPAEYTSDQVGVATVGFDEEKIEPALSTAMQSVDVEQEIPVKVSSESVDST